MRLRIFAIAVAFLLLATLAWRFVFHGVHPSLIVNPPPVTKTHHPQLDVIESIDVQNGFLPDILHELSAKHGFRHVIDPMLLSTSGSNWSPSISLQVDDVTLRALLNRVVREANSEWIVVDAGDHVRITTPDLWRTTATNYTTHFYALPAEVEVDAEQFFWKLGDHQAPASAIMAEAIQRFVAPEIWQSVGGIATVRPYPHGLLITTTPDVHRVIADLLESLAAALDGASTQPILLDQTLTDERGQTLADRLQVSAYIVCDDATWPELNEWLAIEHNVPVAMDDRTAWLKFRSDNTRFNADLRDVPLETGLRLLLRDADLGFEIRDEALFVTNYEPRDSTFRYVLYPIADLLAATAVDGMTLVEALTTAIAPDTWDEVGGEGVCMLLGNCLAIRQQSAIQTQIEMLLDQLRSNTALSAKLADQQFGPPSNHLRNQLLQPVTLDFHEATAWEVAAEIQERCNIPIWILPSLADVPFPFDHRAKFTFTGSAPTLLQALDLLFQGIDFSWYATDHVLVLTTDEVASAEMPVRVYDLTRLRSLDPSSEGLDHDALLELITRCVAPDSWEDVGGPGAAVFVGDQLVVSQANTVHFLLRRLFRALDVATHDADAVRPIPLTVDAESYWNVHHRLDQPAPATFAAETLADAMDQFAELTQLPVRFDRSNRNPGNPAPLWFNDDHTMRVFSGENETIRSLMSKVLWTAESVGSLRAGMVWIEPVGGVPTDEIFVYPITDLQQLDRNTAELLTAAIPSWMDEEVWEENGGYGAVSAFGAALVVRAPVETHRKIMGLLDAMRYAGDHPADRSVQLVDIQIGNVTADAVTMLRSPAASEKAAAIASSWIPRSSGVPELDRRRSLAGLSLFATLQRFALTENTFVDVQRSTIRIGRAADSLSDGRHLAIIPIGDLLPVYVPHRKSSHRPWFLPVGSKDVFGKGSTLVPYQYVAPSPFANFVKQLMLEPWEFLDTSSECEVTQVHDCLVVSANWGGIWQVEAIVRGLRDAMHDRELSWNAAYNASQKSIDCQFQEASVSEIVEVLERELSIPVRVGESVTEYFAQQFTGTGAVPGVPTVEAFDHISFDDGLLNAAAILQAKRLHPKVTPEALVLEIANEPQTSLRVYDTRPLHTIDADIDVGELNRLMRETAYSQQSPAGMYYSFAPDARVEALRGFLAVHATKLEHRRVNTLLRALREDVDWLRALHPGRCKPEQHAALSALIFQRLQRPAGDVERALAIWSLGELPELDQPTVKLLQQDAALLTEKHDYALLTSAAARLRTRAGALVPLLLAGARSTSDPVERVVLVDLVCRCTTQPVRDLGDLLGIVSGQNGNDNATIRTVDEIGKLGTDAQPLLQPLVDLIPLDANHQLLDQALRTALVRIEPERETLARLVEAWMASRQIEPDRIMRLDVRRW